MVTEWHLSRTGNKYPVDGVGVWCDLFGVQKGAKLRLVVLKQQPVQVERPALHHTVPKNGHTEKKKNFHNPFLSLCESCIPMIRP